MTETLSPQSPEFQQFLKVASTWEGEFKGFVRHLRKKGFTLGKGGRKRMLSAFSEGRTAKKRSAIDEYNNMSIDALEAAIGKVKDHNKKRILQANLRKKKLNDKGQKRMRGVKHFDRCLKKARAWKGAYERLLADLSEDGFLFSTDAKRELRDAIGSAQGRPNQRKSTKPARPSTTDRREEAIGMPSQRDQTPEVSSE